MKVAVVKYNAGNIRSVAFALERAGVEYEITDDHATIQAADKVIFPGVGEASNTMNYLKNKTLDKVICNLKQPTLGICLGMQLLCRHSEEHNTPCLGVFQETVRKFQGNGLKVPHMGWNNLEQVRGWLDTALEQKFVYFVHSFYVPVNSFTVAQTQYGAIFSAALQKDNFYAVQFHPEKSSDAGALVIESFLRQS